MKIKTIDYDFSICQVDKSYQCNLNEEYFFLSKTNDEISLVCIEEKSPDNAINKSNGWKGFYIDGTLDFSLIGILADISNILANNKISIFAVSTFNTDYFFVKKENYQKSLAVLKEKGYIL